MTQMLLSVFVSAIIDSYSELTDRSIRPEDMTAFAALWCHNFDVNYCFHERLNIFYLFLKD